MTPIRAGARAHCDRSFMAEDCAALAALAALTPPSQQSDTLADTVPEALIGSLFSYLLGVHLPGRGTNYLKQETHFVASARLGELLRAEVEVTRLRPDKGLVDLATRCTGEDGRLIATGRALVLANDTGRTLIP